MAYDGYVQFAGTEMVNLSRTAQLARTLNIPSVWTNPDSVAWIQTALGGVGYHLITNAPWYDAAVPASTEFAGLLSLSFAGLDDSTREATPVEFITEGGNPGKPRAKTKSIVVSAILIASTERGAAFGKKWLDRLLASKQDNKFCSGSDLTYFDYGAAGAPLMHHRNVGLGRSTSITRKRKSDCSVTWTLTFTLTAGDPYEYSEESPRITSLGAAAGAVGPAVSSSGTVDLVYTGCPTYNYDPIYDPLYPALVPGPAAPNLLPAGWNLPVGQAFRRFWARINPAEPSALPTVPMVVFSTTAEARMVRFSVWPNESTVDDQCDPLFSGVLTYLPANLPIFFDGEQSAVYAWDGVSPSVRRADTLAFNPEGDPMEWAAFTNGQGLLVTLDIPQVSAGVYQGGGNVRAALGLVHRSD